MLNQSLYYTIQYLEPNTKSEAGVVTTPLVADVAKSILVAWRLTYDLFTDLLINFFIGQRLPKNLLSQKIIKNPFSQKVTKEFVKPKGYQGIRWAKRWQRNRFKPKGYQGIR